MYGRRNLQGLFSVASVRQTMKRDESKRVLWVQFCHVDSINGIRRNAPDTDPTSSSYVP